MEVQRIHAVSWTLIWEEVGDWSVEEEVRGNGVEKTAGGSAGSEAADRAGAG